MSETHSQGGLSHEPLPVKREPVPVPVPGAGGAAVEFADLAIIGAGAAGLTAAIFAGQSLQPVGGFRVVLLDGATAPGAKILVAGGGRCNVTHRAIAESDFNFNGKPAVLRRILASFDEHATVRWFESMGVALKTEETGKLFPVADSGRAVLAALLRTAANAGVVAKFGCRVTGLSRQVNHPPDAASPSEPWQTHPWQIAHTAGCVHARRVVLATGGRSLPKSGSDGAAYAWLRRLGHTITDTQPALVPLVLEPHFLHAALSGLSHPATICTWVDGQLADRRQGAMLWTHFGISGPVVLDASRHGLVARAAGRTVTWTLNLLPALRAGLAAFGAASGSQVDDARVEQWLLSQAASAARQTVGQLLASSMPGKLGSALLTWLTSSGPLAASATSLADCQLGQLPKSHRQCLSRALCTLPLPVVESRGWNYAEVTAGGVPMSEVHPTTMASRRLEGLHLAGEVLDCDGRIGGFNFQWAWATGHLAGRAAADALLATTTKASPSQPG